MIKEIAGTQGKYYVTDGGEILNGDGFELQPQLNKDRFYVGIRVNGARKTVAVHRLVAETFCKREPWQNEVHHKDGNPLNNAASNLEWIMQDRHFKLHAGGQYTAIKSVDVHTGEIVLYPSLYTLGQFGIRKESVRKSIEKKYIYLSRLWEYYYEPIDIYGKPLEGEKENEDIHSRTDDGNREF